jgi:transmembrane sensor
MFPLVYMMQDKRLEELFQRYTAGQATGDEIRELSSGLEMMDDESLSQLLENYWMEGEGQTNPFFNPVSSRQMLDKILAEPVTEPVELHPKKKGNSFYIRAAVAAAVVLALITTFYLAWPGKDLPARDAGPVAVQKQLPLIPGSNKATVVLSDGRIIPLDEASKKNLGNEGGSILVNDQGKLIYRTDGQSTDVLYNTVSTPRGGQYQLELADGTIVWLNAASSLVFPTSFPGKDRVVELKGEGYFSVAHHAGKSFHVKIGKMDIEVMGTEFNVNGYEDEPSIKTTLLEGMVRVQLGENFLQLKPGEQAMSKDGALQKVTEVDTEEAVAWKNGRFHFEHADIKTVMRQVKRWYNVDVDYPQGVPGGHYRGKISRNVTAPQVLKILEESGVRFRIEGRKITVLNQKDNQK